LTEIVELVESGQLDQGQLDTHVDPVSRFVTLQPRYGPYETLKARGADLISNRSLRSKIVTLYEDELPNLVEDSVIDRALARDRILPVILDMFWLDASRGWVPKDASNEHWRRELASLSQHRSRTLVNFYLPSFEQSIGLMNEVKRDIEGELQKLD